MPTTPHPNPDVRVNDAGTIWTFTPLTDRASTWFETHTDAIGDNPYGVPTYFVEHRYALDIVAGLRAAGFVLLDAP
jgi:hypothetical protein